mmetsp:Transcript_21322/g.46586  ORF Transcript_21322/g.46586 Transcript_21322/m.46586 type:complete len:296 (-) Transcript_21322:966-1853(-)|eukprot:CAMPEP_0202914934 /NCGR_PEP_ID=MMETSP1392-20130828/64436_1 /ASSEMBLY_ACC=CAM_ASM_000868 /TAXON_ID=225041 /ORGANISM="Chlamydomonas chlamydogama, Strain SAG 11-48b" /LENGTH=295 /DNA_ID=CAMNT_0049606783 /DNA_START=56 /DNA_END=943 /DNA_ORIENTATION=+
MSQGIRRRALLVSCAYPGQKDSLRATANDITYLYDCLTKYCGYDPCDIVVLRDSPLPLAAAEDCRTELPYSNRISNQHNILDWIETYLMANVCEGDRLFFYFSGHGGTQKQAKKGDEADGKDEFLVATDRKVILDDVLNKLLVRPLPKGATLLALVDACHSGTILDLPNSARWSGSSQAFKWDTWNASTPKGTKGGLAVCISACPDDAIAKERTHSGQKHRHGTATFSFVETIKAAGGLKSLTFHELLFNMRFTYAVHAARNPHEPQKVQLSCDRPADLSMLRVRDTVPIGVRKS